MTQTTTQKARVAKKRRLRWRHIWVVLRLKLAVLIAATAISLLAVKAHPVRLPEWVSNRVEARITQSMDGGAITLGAIEVRIEEDWTPRLQLLDVVVFDAKGQRLAQLRDIRARFAVPPLLNGQFKPKTLRLFGADVSLRRTQDGRFDVSFGKANAPVGATGSLVDVLKAVDRAFDVPALTSLTLVEVEQLNIRMEDARSGKIWQVEGGGLALDKRPTTVAMRVSADLLGDAGAISKAAFSFDMDRGTTVATLGANVQNVAASDLAAQSPALSWLAVLDAPISGALRVTVDDAGQLGGLNGTLEIGEGVVQPTQGTKPIGFSSGKAYFSYAPDKQKITFSQLSVITDAARVTAEGQAFLREMDDGWPESLLAQVRIMDVSANPDGIFEEPVRFTGGALDFRLRLDPLSIDVGQMVLIDGDRSFAARGKVGADPDGWNVALDVTLDAIPHDRLLALWPAGLAPKTRDWLSRNVHTGLLFDVKGAIRVDPGTPPRLSLGYEFSDGDVKFLKTLPNVQGARGYATIHDKTYTMVLDEGTIPAPEGGMLDVAGSVFSIPDVTQRPAQSRITLRSESSVTAALSILNEPPFRFLTKAQQPVDLAEGHASVTAQIGVALEKGIKLKDVSYDVHAVLTDLRSDKLVRGRVLTAPRLTVGATPEGIEISGAGKLGRVPAEVVWQQKFGPEYAGKSRVEAKVTLSQDFVEEFGIGLPAGSVTGSGTGQIAIDLLRGQAPSFRLVSDLKDLGFRLPQLGWSKPAASEGSLAVSGQLSSPPQISAIEFDAAGMKASGKVELNPDGALNVARFSRVRIGGWLDAPVDLTGRGKGRPVGVNVTGGTIDVRKTAFTRSGAAQSGPIRLGLDRLVVSEGIVLTGMRGDFGTNGGFNGNFTARVNGGAEVAGELEPSKEGTAIRIRSSDAGSVLRSAGLLEKGYNGSLDLTLVPVSEQGSYDGHLKAKDISIRGAPAMAELLGAISVVGLLEQMNGSGLVFNDVEADFRLTPKSVTVTKSSAVGASLGVSLDGFFDLASKEMDMQGVVSPIYLLNGIGSIFTRKGEGLFGFNFTMKGRASDPAVSVNPLSIFTPGMFRELFRRAPPKVTQ